VTYARLGEWLAAGSAADTSGSGCDGSVVGTSPQLRDRFGLSGQALSFDGTGSSGVTGHPYPALTGTFTLSVWADPGKRSAWLARVIPGLPAAQGPARII